MERVKCLLFITAGLVGLALNIQIIGSSQPGVVETDRDRDGLRGAVKSVATINVSAVQRGASEPGRGSGMARSLIEYNPGGQKTLEYETDSNGAMTFRKVLNYDVQGNLILSIVYTKQSAYSHFFYRRRSGHIATEEIFDSNGTAIGNIQYTYDRLGRLTLEEGHNSRGQRTTTKTISYFKDGTKREVLCGSTIADRLVTFYDPFGSPAESTSYDGHSQLVVRTTFLYDPANRKLIDRAVWGAQGELRGRITYRYDDRGNLFEQQTFSSDNICRERLAYSYEVDLTGNWIKRTTDKSTGCAEKGKVASYETVRREIAYY